ncbi:MAG: LamG domain-containing protein [Planctomycetota bacterium]|jgi:hypothetical protein
MCRKLIYLISFVLLLGLALTSTARADLVGLWRFDEGAGTIAYDSSGNGNDGNLEGGVTWATGRFGGGIELDGTSGYVSVPDFELTTDSITFAIWLNGWKGGDWAPLISSRVVGQCEMIFGSDDTLRYVWNNDSAATWGWTGGPVIPMDTWAMLAVTIDPDRAIAYVYTDAGGLSKATNAIAHIEETVGALQIGWSYDNRFVRGIIDEAAVYDHALTEDEIMAVVKGQGLPYALGPNPANGSVLTDTWVSLSWRPGDFAVSHDVYMGDNFDDVNDGTRDSDVFRSNQGLGLEFYIAGFAPYAYPDGLVPGTTYYWRIDEVNDAEPNSPWKGDVWSFSIPPKTAYFPDPTDGAEFVDLDVQLEWTAGFGAKVHYIVFGEDFDEVSNAATGIPNGTTNFSPGPLKLAKTYFWRVDESDGFETYKGEVWSFTTEGAVSGPSPADGAVDVKPSVVLSWDAGAVAASHEVYFGTDADTVANATATSQEYKGPKALGEESYDPGKLMLNTAYYWRIDEVNGISPDSPWVGNVWSFTTGDYFVIDDFEIYDANDNQIWYTWHDGLGYGALGSDPYFAGNGTGAAVGDENTPSYTEETIVNGGLQSMPVAYDNNKQGYACYSEVELTLTDQRDWTEEGVTELSLWFRGYPGSVGSFIEGPAGTYTMTGSGTDIWGNSDEFHYAYKTLTGVGSIVAKVESVDNTNGWAKAGVMIRETLDPGSVHAMMVVTPAQGISFQRRTVTDDISSHTTTAGIEAPYWVNIERDISGNFTGYGSANGSTWEVLGTWENIQMSTNVYIGLAVTAHNAAATCEAVFTNVTTTGSVSGQWVNQDIGIATNSAEPLYVAVSNSAGTPAVLIHDDPVAAQIDTWTQWVISLQALAEKGINLADVDRIAIGLGIQGNMTVPGGSGKMFFDDIRLDRSKEIAE